MREVSGWIRKLELTRRVRGIQDFIQSLDERRQIHIQDIPEDVEINGIVFMDETIAEPDHRA